MNIICCRSAGTSAISHIYIYIHIYIFQFHLIEIFRNYLIQEQLWKKKIREMKTKII